MNDTTWLTIADLEKQFAGRKPIMRKLTLVFIQTYEGFPQQLDALVQGQDLPAFTRELHSLKGACASLGAERLRTRVAELETALKTGTATPAQTIAALVSFWPDVMQNAHTVLQGLGD